MEHFHCLMQATHQLNVLGYLCPIPVAEAKKALRELTSGHILEIIADDPETQHDLPLLIDRTGHELIETREEAGEFFFLVKVLQND